MAVKIYFVLYNELAKKVCGKCGAYMRVITIDNVAFLMCNKDKCFAQANLVDLGEMDFSDYGFGVIDVSMRLLQYHKNKKKTL